MYTTYLTPSEFRISTKWILGLPVVPEPFTCPLCSGTFDIMGDHAVHCRGPPNHRIYLHNTLRDVLADKAATAYGTHRVTKEQGGDLAPTQHRPGDIRIQGLVLSQDALLDVTTISSTQVNTLKAGAKKKGAAAQLAYDAKQQKWAAHR